MSIWHEVKDKDNIAISEDKETIEIMFREDCNGGNYVDIPIKFIEEILSGLQKNKKQEKTKEEILSRLSDGLNLATKLLEILPNKSNKQLKKWLFNYITENAGMLTKEYYYLSEIKNRL